MTMQQSNDYGNDDGEDNDNNDDDDEYATIK